MPAKMSDSELISLLTQAKEDAAIYTGEFMRENEKYLSAYLGLKDFEFKANPGQSSVVSLDIQDVIESDMPSLARVFLGSGDILSFEANTDSDAELQEAEDKTKLVNWMVRNQPESYKVQVDWIKDALIQKCGVVKYYYDESKDVEEVEYTGVDAVEIQEIIESLRGADVDKVEITEQEQIEGYSEEGIDTFDIKFRVTRVNKCVKIINIPPESFLITKSAASKHDAELIGDVCMKTRSELVADGFDRGLVEQLPTYGSESNRESSINQIRNRDQGGDIGDTETISNWASETVQVFDLYVKIDYDNDGIAERRHVMISGNKVLVNEYFNHQPYAMLSAVSMPHKAIGRSRAEITYQTQLEKTALKRGLLDNIYQSNAPRNVVHDDVDLDDMLTLRQNGIIRLDAESDILPQQAVFPLLTPYTGDKTLQVMQYVDQARANTTGALISSQGLDADAIAKETATRFSGVEKAGQAKIELIARNMAETGYRDLYEGVAWLASRYQNTDVEFSVLGKAMKVNPTKWKYKHHVRATVGLGAGNNEALVSSLQGLYQIQLQLQAAGSNLVDSKKIFNTIKRLVNGLGLQRVDEFINDPGLPDELLMANNEQLQQMVMMLQQELQQSVNPLSEAEQIRAEAKLIEAQAKAQIEAAKMAEQSRQFDIETIMKREKALDDRVLKLTEMEQKYNKQLDREVKSNIKTLSYNTETGELEEMGNDDD